MRTGRGQIKIPGTGNLRGQFGNLFKLIGQTNRGQEVIGEFGAAMVGYLMGFEPAGLEYGNTGIDGLLKHSGLGVYLVMEAKGGTSKLNRRTDPRQFTHEWIRRRLNDLIEDNFDNGGASGRAAELLRASVDNRSPMAAMVVSLNLKGRDGRLKVGLQMYEPRDENDFKHWTGF
ncbi:MAG: hypothetical protein ACRCT8_09855 [Lacipirellulaceae bacterium]